MPILPMPLNSCVRSVEIVTLARNDVTVQLDIGRSILTVTDNITGGAERIRMDVTAQIRNGRTVLPFRYIAESFGAKVNYGPEYGPVEYINIAL